MNPPICVLTIFHIVVCSIRLLFFFPFFIIKMQFLQWITKSQKKAIIEGRCLSVIKWFFYQSNWCMNDDKLQNRRNKTDLIYMFVQISLKWLIKCDCVSVITSIWLDHHYKLKTNCINKARFVYKKKSSQNGIEENTWCGCASRNYIIEVFILPSFSSTFLFLFRSLYVIVKHSYIYTLSLVGYFESVLLKLFYLNWECLIFDYLLSMFVDKWLLFRNKSKFAYWFIGVDEREQKWRIKETESLQSREERENDDEKIANSRSCQCQATEIA